VTLTTDVGAAYAAQIKAVLWSAAPPLTVVDLALDLPAHQVPEAAFLLEHMARGFPPGTVHLAIVDPGVGGRRTPLAVRTHDGSTLIGPENGLLDRLALHLGVTDAARLDPRKLGVTTRIGETFDGRDLFAPAAVALAHGRPLASVGAPHRDIPSPPEPPERRSDGASGQVVHPDRFGNLITDVPSEWVPPTARNLSVRVGGGHWRPATLSTSYEAMPPGRLGLLPSSFGTLELALREGRASGMVSAVAGTAVRLRWAGGPRRLRKGN
jgi:S-adenosylmethionine hydrolase